MVKIWSKLKLKYFEKSLSISDNINYFSFLTKITFIKIFFFQIIVKISEKKFHIKSQNPPGDVGGRRPPGGFAKFSK